jgi:hypothetical protein
MRLTRHPHGHLIVGPFHPVLARPHPHRRPSYNWIPSEVAAFPCIGSGAHFAFSDQEYLIQAGKYFAGPDLRNGPTLLGSAQVNPSQTHVLWTTLTTIIRMLRSQTFQHHLSSNRTTTNHIHALSVIPLQLHFPLVLHC